MLQPIDSEKLVKEEGPSEEHIAIFQKEKQNRFCRQWMGIRNRSGQVGEEGIKRDSR